MHNLYRSVTGGGVVCACLDIRSFNFFWFLKTSILQLEVELMEHLKVWQNCHGMENKYFQFIHIN